MSAVIKNIYDRLKTNIIYPITKEKAVYDDDGVRLDNKLTTINNNLVQITGNQYASDCNAILSTCVRYTQSSTLNIPEAGNGILVSVKQSLGGVIIVSQTYTVIYNNANYKRTYNNGTWSSWMQLADNNNLADVTSGDISTSHTLSDVSYCKKKCGIVNVTINLTTTTQVARYSAVAKIPDGYRPTGYVYCGDAKYAIQPNGNVQTLGTIASGTEIVMSATYICA